MCARTSEEKKLYIVENFISLIQQFGINRVTLSDVADKSGLTKSALYYYFDSKEALLLDGFNYFMEGMKKHLTPVLSKIDDPKEIIEQYALFHLKIMSGEFEEFDLFQKLTDEILTEIEKYIMTVPTVAKAILKSRDEELTFINENIAKYIGQSTEDERTKKITLLFTGSLHSFIALSSKLERKRKAFDTTILTDFPWDLNSIRNKDVVDFLVGGLNTLNRQLFG